MNDASSKIVSDALASQIVQNTTLHLNLSQDAIVITEDKVRLCLIEHLGRIEAKRQWRAPAGVLLTLSITFATTDFNDFFLKAVTWEALFIISTVLILVWLAWAIRKAWGAPSVEDVVASMKRAGATQPQGAPKS
jgi:hypothetical protein